MAVAVVAATAEEAVANKLERRRAWAASERFVLLDRGLEFVVQTTARLTAACRGSVGLECCK